MSKFRRLIPKATDVLIYDSLGIQYLRRAIPDGVSFDRLNFREEIPITISLRFFIQFLCEVVRSKFDIQQSYVVAFINQYQPKVVISFSDRNPLLGVYAEKNPNVLVLVLQNGLRYPEKFALLTKMPVYYLLGNASAEIVKKLEIPCQRVVSAGSLPLGIYLSDHPELVKSNTLVFVSSYRSEFESMDSQQTYIGDLARAHRCVFLHLLEYSKETGIKLTVLAKGKVRCEGEHYAEEQEYFTQLAQGDKFSLLSTVKDSFNSYKVVLTADTVVAIDSTIGYEALSVGCKVLVCWGMEKRLRERSYYFINDLAKEISLVSSDYASFRDKLNTLRELSNDDYRCLIRNCRRWFVSQDRSYPPHIRLQKEITKKMAAIPPIVSGN